MVEFREIQRDEIEVFIQRSGSIVVDFYRLVDAVLLKFEMVDIVDLPEGYTLDLVGLDKENCGVNDERILIRIRQKLPVIKDDEVVGIKNHLLSDEEANKFIVNVWPSLYSKGQTDFRLKVRGHVFNDPDQDYERKKAESYTVFLVNKFHFEQIACASDFDEIFIEDVVELFFDKVSFEQLKMCFFYADFVRQATSKEEILKHDHFKSLEGMVRGWMFIQDIQAKIDSQYHTKFNKDPFDFLERFRQLQQYFKGDLFPDEFSLLGHLQLEQVIKIASDRYQKMYWRRVKDTLLSVLGWKALAKWVFAASLHGQKQSGNPSKL